MASTVPIAIDNNSVQVGLLDSGVNNSHELLRAALPDNRISNAINVQDCIDHTFHGTAMAGLILYGDLTDVAYQRRDIDPVSHILSSVKIIENGYQTDADLSEPLETFQATSAATALATRLAARIKTNNPMLSMLSVRGLMVHVAHWTDEMNKTQNLDERMSLCGYGVPDEEQALFSNEKCATYIFEECESPSPITFNHPQALQAETTSIVTLQPLYTLM